MKTNFLHLNEGEVFVRQQDHDHQPHFQQDLKEGNENAKDSTHTLANVKYVLAKYLYRAHTIVEIALIKRVFVQCAGKKFWTLPHTDKVQCEYYLVI
mmetsp:Transcript_60588/g.91417  ORF Transcript_60588/g.91417 Transcript_60588/m.91417 type:complete len:97 (+) Transcript_60588:96-386(+)